MQLIQRNHVKYPMAYKGEHYTNGDKTTAHYDIENYGAVTGNKVNKVKMIREERILPINVLEVRNRLYER